MRCLAALVARAESRRRRAPSIRSTRMRASRQLGDAARAKGSATHSVLRWGSRRSCGRWRSRSGAKRCRATVLAHGQPAMRRPRATARRRAFQPHRPAALSRPAMFPDGDQRRVRARRGAGPRPDLIWERGVGPTTSSGTGSSASAVAAAAHGGALANVDVVAPGGTQRVEWRDDGVYLTGWAEVVLEGHWIGLISRPPRDLIAVSRARFPRSAHRRRFGDARLVTRRPGTDLLQAALSPRSICA